MKKIILAFLLAFLLVHTVPVGEVSAQIMRNTLDVFSNTKNTDLYKTQNSGLQDYTPEIIYGENKFRGVFFTVQNFIYNVFIPITMVLTVWAGMQLIFSRGDEDVFKKKKTQFLGIFFGFAVLLLSKVMVDDVFFGIERDSSILQSIGDYFGLGGDAENRKITDAGQILNISDSSDFAQRGFRQMEGVFNYMISFAAAVAVVFVIFTGFKMITSLNDDEISKARKKILFVIGGMAVLVTARRVVGLFRDEGSSQLSQLYTRGNLSVPNVSGSVNLVVDWINFALSFIGIIAIIGLIYGGVKLIGSMGQNESAQEEAKKIVFASIAGIILAISAWTIVYYFIAI